ncbi:MAG TPA: HPr family phosphocarrier protein [Candidatus Polarisedimenticolia bacterium]|nr:HPr family phosphocarrier protein [Candidatus Polarisedimenticolia bacterium]
MIEREVTLINALGLHARAAARLVQVASRFRARITLTKEGRTVDAKSILGVLMLSGALGDRLLLAAHGEDEDEALAAVEALFLSRFGEAG